MSEWSSSTREVLEQQFHSALARAERAEAEVVELRVAAESMVEVARSGHTAEELYEASDELEAALSYPSPEPQKRRGYVPGKTAIWIGARL